MKSFLVLYLAFPFISWAQSSCPKSPVKDVRTALKQSNEWFGGEEARRTAGHIRSHQSPSGGWPKNQSTTAELFDGDRNKIRATFDNGATTDELRFLARVFNATKNPLDKQAFLLGLDHVLEAQYSNGGWPQYHPPGKGYHRHITFNDNAMVRLLEFVREVANEDLFNFVDQERRKRGAAAFEKGISCILNCQIKVNGELTVWCAQHDRRDFRPQSARSYELATLSGCESVGITRLLMSLKNPNQEVIEAVEGAVAWFESVKLEGIRIERARVGKGSTDTRVIADPSASPLWARFYHLKDNTPVFADRDGVPKKTLAEIGHERRNGYAWYGSWPHDLVTTELPVWRKRIKSRIDRRPR